MGVTFSTGPDVLCAVEGYTRTMNWSDGGAGLNISGD